MFLDTGTAEHEAAHVVVGLALGLRLRKATIRPQPFGHSGIALGLSWFAHDRRYLAVGIMFAAGVAWDRRTGWADETTHTDYELARSTLKRRADVDTAVRLAGELIDGRRRVHARIASELCDRDLNAADIAAMVIE